MDLSKMWFVVFPEQEGTTCVSELTHYYLFYNVYNIFHEADI
jgi:hypothetical protein